MNLLRETNPPCLYPSRPRRFYRKRVLARRRCNGVFWRNDDRDSSGQDAQTGAVDSADNKVLHVRDLEDFAQIAVKVPASIKDKILNQGYKLAIQTTGGLQVNVFKAV